MMRHFYRTIMKKYFAIVVFIIGFLSTFSSHAVAQINNPAFLRDIDSMFVFVDDRDSIGNLRSSGISPSEIKKEVELELRSRGIKVKKSAFASLYINVNIMPIDDNLDKTLRYVFNIEVSLNDWLVSCNKVKTFGLAAKESISGRCITWSKSSLGTVGASKIEHIKSQVIDIVKDFINDYLEANQKMKPRPRC